MFGNSKPGWFGSKLNINIELLQSGDYRAIPWIFCVFAESHAASKTVAAKALCTALDRLAFDELVHIDERMRQTTSMEWTINWRNYSIDRFFTFAMNKEERRAVIIFASFNPNGFIRERAVRMMKDYAGTLPFTILRQNDWVSQVREVAGETADYRLSHLSKGELIAALPFADKLGRSGRTKRENTYADRIYSALTSRENENELIDGLRAANIRTRRICTDALFNRSNPRFDLAFDRLEHEPDPFLRANSFRRLMLTGQDMDTVAGKFLRDKYLLNRILAFQYICGKDRDKALQLAQDLLLDKSAVVRDNIRCFLNSSRIDFDYRTFYKTHLTDGTVPAIYGLGETGEVEDVAVIDEYLSVSQISVVRAAMTAVMHLCGEKYAAAITAFLADDRAGIVKTARNLILKTDSPDYEKVMGIFRSTPHENTKRKCFSILVTASKWQRLIFILDVLETGGEEMAGIATQALQRWTASYNRSFVMASKAQIEQITESIKQLGDNLTENMQRQLLFLVK